MARSSSFSNALADKNQPSAADRQPQHRRVDPGQGRGSVLRRESIGCEQLISGLAADRDPIGQAITALDDGTASLADLLSPARPPLAGVVDQLNRLAPAARRRRRTGLDTALQKAPENYRKLVRLGSYGSFDQLLHLLDLGPGHRPARSDRGLPACQAREREVRGALMLKYRGSNLVRAGFIGAVLIAPGHRGRACTGAAGAVGDVGALPGAVHRGGRHRRRQRRDCVRRESRYGHRHLGCTTATRWSRSPSTDASRWVRPPPRTSAPEPCSGERVLTLESDRRDDHEAR